LIRAAVAVVIEILLFGACLFGAAGSLSWLMAWAVLGVYTVPKARTSREDRTLQAQLDGYREYQARVRWRLLPGVW
jgi:protein-S-isoprenylcysteine O-methyltransferase Ste14